jgi:alginate O-acetyltransferase complex protein AlgI
MTENTIKTGRKEKTLGILFYDGTCGFCLRGIRKIRKPLATRAVEVRPFADGGAEPEMKLHWHDGRILGGARAAIFLARRFPITFVPALLAGIPPFRNLAELVYRHIAANRHCRGGNACPLDLEEKPARIYPGWILTAGLVALAFLAGVVLPIAPWAWMWLIASAMWLGFKGMSFRRAGGFSEIDPLFFLWPGMDTDGFAYDRTRKIAPINPLPASVSILLGILILVGILPFTDHAITRGWLGVGAMICLLHFGLFDFLAGFYRSIGYGAEPIMRQPWLSRGLGEFWGPRWNRGFSDWARNFLFGPLHRKWGTVVGTIAGFLASGIAHELVISVPAGGGYGLPTLYFLIQGTGLLLEKKANLRHFRISRAWVWAVVLLPAPLLFHAPFLIHVFNPMTNLLINR